MLPFRIPPPVRGIHLSNLSDFLTSRAERAGYHAELVLAGRRINEAMSGYVAGRVVEIMSRAGIRVAQARILVLGFAFKENCPDVRNIKVADLVASLEATVDVFDPWIARRPSSRSKGRRRQGRLAGEVLPIQLQICKDVSNCFIYLVSLLSG